MSATRHRSPFLPVSAWARALSRGRGRVTSAVLVAGVLASGGAGAVPAATTARAFGVAGPVAGTLFVANAGADAPGAQGTGKGSITVYRPGTRGDARPLAVITKGIDGPGGLAFDAAGDLWVANVTGTVVEYKKAALAVASPKPTRMFHYKGIGLAFDPGGNLWIATDGTIVEFTKAALAKPGEPKSTVSVVGTCGVAFDAAGDLWAGSTDNWVSEYTKAALAKSGSAAVPVTINVDSLSGPCKPTFDAAGDLWVGNFNATTVVEIAKANLARAGSPAAKVVISASPSLVGPGDVAFSPAGDLWVPYMDDGTVAKFTKRQLAKSGSPRPALTIAGPHSGLNWPWALAIEP